MRDRQGQTEQGGGEHEEEVFKGLSKRKACDLGRKAQLRVGDRSQTTQCDQIPALCSSLRDEWGHPHSNKGDATQK